VLRGWSFRYISFTTIVLQLLLCSLACMLQVACVVVQSTLDAARELVTFGYSNLILGRLHVC
jgi:hypothetical protein